MRGCWETASQMLSLLRVLQLYNIRCSRTFGSIYNIEDNFGTFFQGFEAFGFDAAMMNKEITSIFLGNKAISLCIVKPFYCSF